MEVSGKAIYTIPKAITKKFGKKGLEQWLEAITAEARLVYSFPIDHKEWFPLKETMVEPMAKIAQLFYKWDLEKAGWEFGGFSAEYGISGLKWIAFKTLPPGKIIAKAVDILPTYYKPSKMELITNEKGLAIFRITEFPEIDKTTEYRTAGWMLQALKISGQKNPQVKINKWLTKFDPYSEFQLSWG